MDVPADGAGEQEGQPWLETGFPVFTAQVWEQHGWRQLTEPQRDAQAACMMLAAFIWTQAQDMPMLALQSQVRDALRRLNEGAREVAIGECRHRVVRTDLYLDVPIRPNLTEPSGS